MLPSVDKCGYCFPLCHTNLRKKAALFLYNNVKLLFHSLDINVFHLSTGYNYSYK